MLLLRVIFQYLLCSPHLRRIIKEENKEESKDE